LKAVFLWLYLKASAILTVNR